MFTSRRIAYCVLRAAGWKGKEEEILAMPMDEKRRKAEIEKYGYVTFTTIGQQQ